jgi:fused signal recognition particle receptor
MGLFDRLKTGLTKSSRALSDGLGNVLGDTLGRRRLDAQTLSELEDLLITADLGLTASANIIDNLRQQKIERDIGVAEIKTLLADDIARRLQNHTQRLETATAKPFVILMTGVNGAGKTTTIGKLARKFLAEGKSVMLAAGDTFRAAAIEQLSVWGERSGVPVITTKPGGDAAGLSFEALEKATAEQTDILIIDTAGRLQSNDNLMAELEKIIRVLKKIDPNAPHASLLVLDATTGQNALSQAEVFRQSAATTGLVMTKLDGTARGGVLVAIAEKTNLPIYFIGVGETAEDLQVFDPVSYARALVGLGDVKAGEDG